MRGEASPYWNCPTCARLRHGRRCCGWSRPLLTRSVAVGYGLPVRLAEPSGRVEEIARVARIIAAGIDR